MVKNGEEKPAEAVLTIVERGDLLSLKRSFRSRKAGFRPRLALIKACRRPPVAFGD